MMNIAKKNVIKLFPNTLKRCYSSLKWLEPNGFKTGLKVYNSSSKSKVELVTKRDKILSWYSCGPTVYDSAHIGHACCYMQYDIIRRIIEETGINVVYVMGVTDIDDKIIAKSNKLGVDFKNLSKQYENEFFNDLMQLNIKMPDVKARVSDHIESIVNFVQVIVDNGLGYVGSDGSVNFSVDKYQLYGKLVNLRDGENENINRDFAMWKKSKPGEPSWDSPWGPGRPGWHIECSAMASRILGHSIDIHTGGIDLKFPHHENEEAQCCAHHNINQWVNYWLHTGHLYISPEAKMSKSLKNTISIQDFLSDYSPNHLRMLCMMVPYRHPIEYNQEVIGNALNLERKFVNFISDCEIYTKNNRISLDESFLLNELEKAKNSVDKNLKDDFDTPSAILNINKLISATNSQLKRQTDLSESPSYSIIAISNFVNGFLQKLGFSYDKTSNNDILLKDIIESVVDFRAEVRKSALNIKKNESEEVLNTKTHLLKACDSLRDGLIKSGIELKDHGQHTSWNLEQPNVKKKLPLK